jgi:quercetin dioxygenase-like cupin family protein
MKKKWTFFGVVFLAMFVVISAGFAADKTAPVAKNVILTPDEIQWKEGPKALPETKMAVLEGDPGKRGFFVARLKLPAGTKIPPHVHKNMERVTVISGKFNLAMGDKPENPKVLPAGSYFSLPPRTVHNAWADEDTILQISTYGPWTFKLVGKEAEKK